MTAPALPNDRGFRAAPRYICGVDEPQVETPKGGGGWDRRRTVGAIVAGVLVVGVVGLLVVGLLNRDIGTSIQDALAEGKRPAAPDITLPVLAAGDGIGPVGSKVALKDLRGKTVVLNFWASWCGPCKQSFPFMNDLQAKYRAQGFEILAVNLDAKRDDADKFLAEVPAQFTLAFDAKGDSAKRFEIKGMPSSYLIGRDGKVVAAHKGFKEQDRKDLEMRITQALVAQ